MRCLAYFKHYRPRSNLNFLPSTIYTSFASPRRQTSETLYRLYINSYPSWYASPSLSFFFFGEILTSHTHLAFYRLSPLISSTLLLSTRRNNTNSKDLYNLLTPISWTSNALVSIKTRQHLILRYTETDTVSIRLLRHHHCLLPCTNRCALCILL